MFKRTNNHRQSPRTPVRSLHFRKRLLRRGAAVTEFAIVAPVFFMMVIGFIEFGRALMVQQVLINASRVGARMATTTGATSRRSAGRSRRLHCWRGRPWGQRCRLTEPILRYRGHRYHGYGVRPLRKR